MVSLSIGRVIRRKRRLLPRARLHQFHRPSDGTSGELGFIRPRSSFSFLLYEFPRDVKNYLFDQIKQIIPCVMLKHEWHTSVLYLLGMIGRPLGRASCQSSPKPEGAEIDSECACQATIGLP